VAAELNDPRLTRLRESDPAEWTARRDEIGQRLQHLREVRMKAAQAYDQYTQQTMQQMRERELKALNEAVPDFGKEHAQKARETLNSLGMSEQEIGNVMDHRLIRGALELAELRAEVNELRELQSKAKNAVKRVKKDVPKLQKPAKQQRKSASGLQRDKVAQLRQRARKTGRVEDAAKVIESMI